MVKNGAVRTSTGQYCMKGITRGKVVQICHDNDIPVFEKNFSLVDVYDGDEAFVTGTFAGLIPVVSVDGRVIGDGQRLCALYATRIEAVVRENDKSRRV
jgi:branched-chain amino acid aminotransferase